MLLPIHRYSQCHYTYTPRVTTLMLPVWLSRRLRWTCLLRGFCTVWRTWIELWTYVYMATGIVSVVFSCYKIVSNTAVISEIRFMYHSVWSVILFLYMAEFSNSGWKVNALYSSWCIERWLWQIHWVNMHLFCDMIFMIISLILSN